MTENISLKETERKVFTSTFKDGLWDIFIGCFFLEFAIGPFLSNSLGDFWSSAVFLPFWALVYGIIWVIRKRIVKPRIGIVRFGQQRRTKLIRFNLVMFAVLVFGLILSMFALRDYTHVSGWIISLRFSLIMLVAFGVAAYFLNFNRLYLYGILAALSPVVGEWLFVQAKVPHHGFPVTFGITSGIMMIIGIVEFIRLLRTYPVPTEELSSKEV